MKPPIPMFAALLLAACAGQPGDRTVDRSAAGPRPLSELKAGIWVDPNGCDHWLIDDGQEGYLSARLDPYGKPVCSGVAPPNTYTGPLAPFVPGGEPY